MQLPFANLLGLATGAVGLISKAFNAGSGKAGFEAELNAAIEGGTKTGKAGLMKALKEKGILDEGTLGELMGCTSGMTLVQFMSELKNLGVSTKDIGVLMGTDASKFSDDSLRKLLASFGIDGAGIDKIMSDAKTKAEIVTNLAGSLKNVLGNQAVSEGLDPEMLVKLATADDETVERLIAAAQAKAAGKQTQTDALNQAVNEMNKTSQNMLTALENAPAVSSLSAITVREIIANALKSIGISVDKAAGNASASAEAVSLAGKKVIAAENVFGIKREVLNDLFFSTDDVTRNNAVAQVSRQINAYLASNSGKQLQPEVTEALSLLKTAMSEKEFSGIDNSLKLWKPDLVIPDARAEMDRSFYTALAKQLGNNDPSMVYERHMKQVMDQIRRGIPSQMKGGEGSVTLKLHPPMLGRVDVNMSMNEGQLNATFKTDQTMTRDILLQNIHVLRESLAEQGIRVTNFSITAGLEERTAGQGYAFAGQDRQNQGFGRHDRQLGGTQRSFREDDELVYARTTAGQGIAAGGLDIFA
ncbi:MAG: flagellar hook-length control protein FliK [Deltaproteobacteria bacterium]|nr:flagellar hook-length control protein FliK [Deltaproteobacteria bacterium]